MSTLDALGLLAQGTGGVGDVRAVRDAAGGECAEGGSGPRAEGGEAPAGLRRDRVCSCWLSDKAVLVSVRAGGTQTPVRCWDRYKVQRAWSPCSWGEPPPQHCTLRAAAPPALCREGSWASSGDQLGFLGPLSNCSLGRF